MLTTVSPPCISVKQSCVHTPTFRCLCCLVTWLGTVTSWGTRVWTFSATLGKSLFSHQLQRESSGLSLAPALQSSVHSCPTCVLQRSAWPSEECQRYSRFPLVDTVDFFVLYSFQNFYEIILNHFLKYKQSTCSFRNEDCRNNFKKG